MTITLLRGAAAFCLALTPLTLPSPTAMAATATAAVVPVPAVLPLEDAVGRLPLAEEDRTGYTRTSFRHWNTGLDPADGCNTRNEALLTEAVQEPTVAAGCRRTERERSSSAPRPAPAPSHTDDRWPGPG